MNKMKIPKKIKSRKEFNNLLKKGKYQVFVMKSSFPFPLCFAAHAFVILVNTRNQIKRKDFGKFLVEKGLKHDNISPPDKGLVRSLIFGGHLGYFKPKIIGYLEGKTNSEAEKLSRVVKKSFQNYPYSKKYVLYPGPNSNTFVQWILNQVPGIDIKLPWSAFGKNYLKNKKKEKA